eukprot:scaffold57115_cov55-Attheya_sp.AAC.2
MKLYDVGVEIFPLSGRFIVFGSRPFAVARALRFPAHRERGSHKSWMPKFCLATGYENGGKTSHNRPESSAEGAADADRGSHYFQFCHFEIENVFVGGLLSDLHPPICISIDEASIITKYRVYSLHSNIVQYSTPG